MNQEYRMRRGIFKMAKGRIVALQARKGRA